MMFVGLTPRWEQEQFNPLTLSTIKYLTEKPMSNLRNLSPSNQLNRMLNWYLAQTKQNKANRSLLRYPIKVIPLKIQSKINGTQGQNLNSLVCKNDFYIVPL